MEYSNINKEFVSRTLKILQDYNGKFEVTLLVNCCVGLLVLPREEHEHLIPNTEIPATGKLWGISRVALSFGPQAPDYCLKEIVRRLRNGVCHFNVKTVPDGSGDISKIAICDSNRNKTSTFQAIFTVDELRQFTTSLANCIK